MIQWYERAYCLALKSSTNAQLIQQLLDAFTNASKVRWYTLYDKQALEFWLREAKLKMLCRHDSVKGITALS